MRLHHKYKKWNEQTTGETGRWTRGSWQSSRADAVMAYARQLRTCALAWISAKAV